ncbi:MAG: hypothetical protein CMJ83_14390 [Planctomycetes bacterium]|nr:hypothetical protein [Planctomycetota bacterium]
MVKVAIGVAALGALLLAAWLLGQNDASRDVDRTSTAPVTDGAETAAVGSEPVSGPLQSRRFTEPANDPPVPAGPEVSPGELHFRIVDGSTGRDLEDVALRAVSTTRVFQARVTSPVETTVPGGRVSLLLRKPGYERARRDVTVSPDDGPQDLDTIAMSRGDGGIEGHIEHAESDVACRVASLELHGAGRSPIGPGRCENEGHDLRSDQRCSRCGWGPTRTRTLPEHETFRFERLAGGPYLVVARSASGAVLTTQRVELKPHERKTVVIRVAFRDLTVRIEDSKRQPFDGVWHENGLWFSSRVRIFFWTDGLCSAAAEIVPADQGYVVNQDVDDPTGKRERPPRPTGVEVDLGLEAAAKERERKRAASARSSAAAPPVERPRRDGEDLWPRLPSPTPSLKTNPLSARRIAPGTYEVKRVPISAHRALAACGPMFTMSENVDLEDSSTDVLVLRLHKKCGADFRLLSATARGPRKRVSCTACHALPANIFQ